MPSTETSVLDYVVTYGGPSIFMTAVFVVVLPLVYFKFARPRYPRWPARLAILLAVWLGAFVIAYGDVFLIARDAQRLCEQEAGLKVYRTVEAKGFAGVSSIDTWAGRGFEYVEDVGVDGNKYRYSLSGGTPVAALIPKFSSRYELTVENELKKSRVELQTKYIRDNSTKEVTAKLVTASISPGWLDLLLLNAVGAGWTRMMCEGAGGVISYENIKFPITEFIGKAIHAACRK